MHLTVHAVSFEIPPNATVCNSSNQTICAILQPYWIKIVHPHHKGTLNSPVFVIRVPRSSVIFSLPRSRPSSSTFLSLVHTLSITLSQPHSLSHTLLTTYSQPHSLNHTLCINTFFKPCVPKNGSAQVRTLAPLVQCPKDDSMVDEGLM